MNATQSRKTLSFDARQILAIASNSRCDADAKNRPDGGASFTSPAHRRRIAEMVSTGLLEIVSVGKWAGLKEYNARLTPSGVVELDSWIHAEQTACHHCGRVHY